MIVFFDACALIYMLEGTVPFADNVHTELAILINAYPNAKSAVSRLSWLECRIAPLRNADKKTLALYDAFFERPDLIWVEMTREVVELATVIRAKHGLRTPNALQAASCLQLGQQHLLFTGDQAFQRVDGLNVRVVS